MIKALLTAATIAALPLAAGAVPVAVTEVAENFYYGTGSVTGKNDVSFEFAVPTTLNDFTVEISGTGVLIGATLSYSLNGAAPVAITSPFSNSFTIGDFGPGTYSVAYDFTGTPKIPLSMTATVYGTVPSAVPLPAAGLLAVAGIASLGALRARRNKNV